jgi:hypothetical protein
LSAFSNKFSITPILSDTLDPPKIATNGRSGASTAFLINLISFSSKKPATAFSTFEEIPTFEA